MPITNRGKFRTLRALAHDEAWPAFFRVALVSDVPTPDTKTMSELSEIAAGNGYTSGGVQITRDVTGFPAVVEDDADNLASAQIKDVPIAASGGTIPTSGGAINYGVLIDDNATLADAEIWAYSYVLQDTIANGETLTLANWLLQLLEAFMSGVSNAANIGAGGVGLFKVKNGDVLEFRNINVASPRVSLTLDAPNNEVDIDVIIDDAGVTADELLSALEIDSRIAAAAAAGTDYICILDQKASGTEGGTFTQDAWRTRDLTVEQADAGGHAALSSNQITLQPGTYRCLILCPARAVGRHKAKLYNITDTADVLIGGSEVASAAAFNQSISMISGRFTLAASKVLEVRHYCQTTAANTGFGLASNFSVAEIYTQAMFWKEA